MEVIRKKILKTHGTIAVLVGIAMAIASTIGATEGIGVFKFLQQNKLVHAGLLQAYLLFALIGIILLMGSREQNVRRWNRVGAAAHVLILIAYLLHWNLFSTIENGYLMRTGGLIFHSIFLSLELWASFSANKNQ
ncbi:MAG: hypothetical protein ABI723_03830 [Bacteroidia bacterium]